MTVIYQPALTIVIPTFNSIVNLPACLESVQSVLGTLLGRTVFVLIQDGRSTDGTREYAENINSSGITLVSEQDSGVYDAMNKAVARAGTDWIYFLGSDDRLLPDFKVVLSRLTNTNQIYYANVRFSSNGKPYDGAFSPAKLVFRNICHQSIFFPRHILRKEPYSLSYPVKSDWASNIRFFASIPFQYIDLNVALYNDSGGLSSTYEDVEFERDKAKLFHDFHGYWLKLLCGLSPIVTKIYHFSIRHKTEGRKKFGDT
tara:strand:+ start:2197 stop:2970 length:774 start_codon:yes stop_codon:yes gene_type:complete